MVAYYVKKITIAYSPMTEHLFHSTTVVSTSKKWQNQYIKVYVLESNENQCQPPQTDHTDLKLLTFLIVSFWVKMVSSDFNLAGFSFRWRNNTSKGKITRKIYPGSGVDVEDISVFGTLNFVFFPSVGVT